MCIGQAPVVVQAERVFSGCWQSMSTLSSVSRILNSQSVWNHRECLSSPFVVDQFDHLARDFSTVLRIAVELAVDVAFGQE